MTQQESSLAKARGALTVLGLRRTFQRARLVEMIQGAGQHLDAEGLHQLARQRGYNISLSTVYRTLALLKKRGLIDELHFDEEHHHYESAAAQEHHHLVCLGCGQVTEFSGTLTKRLREALTEKYDFQIASASIELTGYCARCRKER